MIEVDPTAVFRELEDLKAPAIGPFCADSLVPFKVPTPLEINLPAEQRAYRRNTPLVNAKWERKTGQKKPSQR